MTGQGDGQAETPMRDHVNRFFRLLETEHVRILVDIRRDHDEGQPPHWDSASFGNDVAKAIAALGPLFDRLFSQREGGGVPGGYYLQIGGVTSSDFGNTDALRVRVGTDNKWEWRKVSPAEYAAMLGALNVSASPAPPEGTEESKRRTTPRLSGLEADWDAEEAAPPKGVGEATLRHTPRLAGLEADWDAEPPTAPAPSPMVTEEEIARVREALDTCEAWIDRWTGHVGRCAGADECTCGRTAVLHEARAILSHLRQSAEPYSRMGEAG